MCVCVAVRALMGRVRLPGCGGGGGSGTATLWLPALLLLLLLTVGVLVGTFALFYRVSCACLISIVQLIIVFFFKCWANGRVCHPH